MKYSTVEAFMNYGSGSIPDEGDRNYQMRKLFLEMLMFPEFHVMTRDEQGAAVGIDGLTVGRWIAQVPDEYLAEALKVSRERHAKQSFEVDASLMRECKAGNVKAMDLYYRRIEGWVPKQDMELSRGRDKELDGKANFELLKALVQGLSPEQKRELLGGGVEGAIEANVERLDGVVRGGAGENGQQSG